MDQSPFAFPHVVLLLSSHVVFSTCDKFSPLADPCRLSIHTNVHAELAVFDFLPSLAVFLAVFTLANLFAFPPTFFAVALSFFRSFFASTSF